MADPSNFRMRVYFRKTGRLTLLSHLEIARAVERAVRRAGLPYAISQGFSPHMKVAFGAALPVGVGGERECFDLQLTRYVAPNKVVDALKASSADDLMVLACEAIGPKEPAASAAYPFSRYRVELDGQPPLHLEIPETVTVVRKKKEKELCVVEYLQGAVEVKGSTLEFTLLAKPTGSLRPDRFVAALLEACPETTATAITRIAQSSSL